MPDTERFNAIETMVSQFPDAVSSWKESVARNPKAIVLSDSLGADLTRGQIDEMSDKVCAFLQSKSVGTGDFVLIQLQRGVASVVAILGVLKAGAAFSVVEADYAKERIEFIRTDCGAKLAIDDAAWKQIMATEPSREYAQPSDHDPCMAVYTSGTTGIPKGVIHEYGQIKLEMISERRSDGTWRENETTRWGLVAPLNFVASLKIVVHFLYCGGHLYVIDYDTVKNTTKLSLYFLRHRINETFLSPSLIRLRGDSFGPAMKFIYTGAEPANDIFIEGVELNNTYTMSESFFTVCEFIIDKAYPVVPIGMPKFDLPIHLLDEENQVIAEPGATGEFCYANPFCRGYINNPKENARGFVDGYFRTGDLASFDGTNYTLKGRRDDMIKINGNRIEPAEIEAACKRSLGLANCIAKGFEKEATVAVYYTDDVTIDVKKAQIALEDVLPYYMIPAHYVKINEIPVSSSGKADRKLLSFPVIARKAKYVAPRNDTERALAASFERVLNIDNIGIDDDFFNLGGSSILAIKALTDMEDSEGFQGLTISHLYRGRTIRGLVELAAQDHSERSPEEKEMFGREKGMPVRHFPLAIYPALKAFPESTTFNMYGAYRLNKSFLISGKKLVKAINDTIANSSLMQAVVRERDGEAYWAYAPERYSEIKLETMSEKDVRALCNTFVKGFGTCTDMPMYRIRVISTCFHLYILADFNHMLTNGYGVNLFIQDVVSAYTGKVNTDNRFFETLYDFEHFHGSDEERKCDELLSTRYLPYVDNMHFKDKGAEGDEFIKEMYELPFDNALLERHLKQYGITRNTFVNTVIVSALSIFNNERDAGALWGYNGVSGSKNHTAFSSKSLPVAFLKAPYASVVELYADISQQNLDCISCGQFYFDYYSTFIRENTHLNVNIDYLGSLESDDALTKLGGKKIELRSDHDTDIQSDYVIAQVLDVPHGFNLRLWHPVRELTRENAQEFVGIIGNVIDSLLKGMLPSLPAK